MLRWPVIGYEVGYNSKSTFYTASKKVTDTTPALFKESLCSLSACFMAYRSPLALKHKYEVHYIFREKSIINNELKHWFGQQKLSLTLGIHFGRSTHNAKQNNKNDEERRAGL
jgi:AraC-like DNA-binding protein